MNIEISRRLYITQRDTFMQKFPVTRDKCWNTFARAYIFASFSDVTSNDPLFLCSFSFSTLFFPFSFFFRRRSSTTSSLSRDRRVPIVTSAAPLFFIPSRFYLELLIYRGHWRRSRRSVKSLNVMRCYYLRGRRRLSKSGSTKVVMHTQRYIHRSIYSQRKPTMFVVVDFFGRYAERQKFPSVVWS